MKEYQRDRRYIKMSNQKNLPWKESIIRVLKEKGSAMHYTEIADEIVANGYRTKVGANPSYTVNRIINGDINENGINSLFLKTDKAYFILRDKNISMKVIKNFKDTAIKEYEDDVLEIINAFGMYWRREGIVWSNNSKLLGKEQSADTEVDFADQKGVYLLYDDNRIIYVGRAIEQGLGQRLYQHTIDRLNGRWNRFSWFGILKVTNEGKLTEPNYNNFKIDDFIMTMEALLIEGLEPPQNRKREVQAVEYLQIEDPELENASLIKKLKAKLNK